LCPQYYTSWTNWTLYKVSQKRFVAPKVGIYVTLLKNTVIELINMYKWYLKYSFPYGEYLEP